jgi:hypothetical protein
MKKVFKYFGVLLSVALMGAVTACNPTEIEESTDIGLGIKVFFPTKVVAGQPMTINGSGLSDVREIIFPEGVSVTNFEIVSNDMIRVIAPSGIAAAGGNLKVRTADDEAESRVALTLGRTDISGYSKQDGETIDGGEQLTIYGKDLEFISRIELLDTDGNPLILEDEDFYRKGTSSVIITIPKTTIFDGTFVGKAYTFDGREFSLPELTYVPGSEGGGHWETVKTVIWSGDGSAGAVSWSGQYRYGLDGHDGNNECIATFPQEIWDKIKTETFYVLLKGEDPQIRVTSGWWSTTWTGADIQPGNEKLTDNGDGTWTLEVNLTGDPLLDVLDEQHLLLTGDRYTPLEIYFQEEQWVDGGGHWETVKTTLWKGDGSAGAVSWSGQYRYGLDGHDGNNECIATFPQEIWDKIKSETFYVLLQGEDPQIRVTSGWWSTTWTGADIQPGNEKLTDNGDGTWTLEVNLSGDPLLDVLDEQHLLLTGDRYTPLEIYFAEEVWVDGDDSGGAKEVVIWEGDGSAGAVSWSGQYRYGLDGHDGNNECIATFPADVWEKIKSGTFYVLLQGEDPQIRVTSGWWSTTWTGADIQPGNEKLTDNGDGTWTLEVNLTGDPLLDVLDEQHLLLTGDRYTPMKIFFLE